MKRILKTIPVGADGKLPEPPHGGSWERRGDGSLALVEESARGDSRQSESAEPTDTADGASQGDNFTSTTE